RIPRFTPGPGAPPPLVVFSAALTVPFSSASRSLSTTSRASSGSGAPDGVAATASTRFSTSAMIEAVTQRALPPRRARRARSARTSPPKARAASVPHLPFSPSSRAPPWRESDSTRRKPPPPIPPIDGERRAQPRNLRPRTDWRAGQPVLAQHWTLQRPLRPLHPPSLEA